MPVTDTSNKTLYKVVRNNTTKSDPIYADEIPSHDDTSRRHRTSNYSAKELANSIESAWVTLKQKCNVIYHNWDKKHCRFYTNELPFSLNEGKCSIDTQDRPASPFKRMASKHITYKELAL